MKERKDYKLPSKVGGEDVYLPDYETIIIDGVEIEVHPDFKERFLEQREEMNEKER